MLTMFWYSFSGLEPDVFKSWSLRLQQCIHGCLPTYDEVEGKVLWGEQKFPVLHVIFLCCISCCTAAFNFPSPLVPSLCAGAS